MEPKCAQRLPLPLLRVFLPLLRVHFITGSMWRRRHNPIVDLSPFCPLHPTQPHPRASKRRRDRQPPEKCQKRALPSRVDARLRMPGRKRRKAPKNYPMTRKNGFGSTRNDATIGIGTHLRRASNGTMRSRNAPINGFVQTCAFPVSNVTFNDGLRSIAVHLLNTKAVASQLQLILLDARNSVSRVSDG